MIGEMKQVIWVSCAGSGSGPNETAVSKDQSDPAERSKTEEMFVNALKTGKHMGTSRTIQPPMPWPWVAQATEEDLKAIYAYLRTIPPIENQVPDYQKPQQ